MRAGSRGVEPVVVASAPIEATALPMRIFVSTIVALAAPVHGWLRADRVVCTAYRAGGIGGTMPHSGVDVTLHPPMYIATLALLVGCQYRLIPEARVCEDLAYAISERTRVCTEDPGLANDRHDTFVDRTRCLLSDEVEDPYNPEGILPAPDQPEEVKRLERLYDCVRAAREASCDAVSEQGDDPSYWLSLEASCADVAAATGGGR